MKRLENITYEASMFGPDAKRLMGLRSRLDDVAHLHFRAEHGKAAPKPMYGAEERADTSELVQRLGALRSAQVSQALARMSIARGESGPAAGLGDKVKRWWQRQVGRRELARLDEQGLRDLGITRDDAQREAKKPFWRS
jgi:uncharacterized protein YjiS (DUF1127 family)